MLRLTFLLCIGMFAALYIAGEDRGQLRPGLAEAAARKVLPGSESGDATEVAAADIAPEPTSKRTQPVSEAPAAEPDPYVEPDRELVTRVEEPVFSLSDIGNEAIPVAPEAAADGAPEVAAGGEGTIWYVSANSVNVRSAPSTEAEVVGKLGSGEATLMIQAVNDEWARIVIQGDGVEGFVALRYLSPEAP